MNPGRFLLIILSLSLGLLFGVVILIVVSTQTIPPDSPLYSPLASLIGIKKPQVIGFLPYWLTSKAQDSYKNKITTLTYFSLTIDSDGKILKLLNSQEEEPGWTTLRREDLQERFTKAKKEKITTSLLVHNSDEEAINKLLENPVVSAQNLVTEVFPIMNKYGFSDLNLDIESFKTASSSSQIAYLEFIKEVYQAIKQQNLGTLTIEITPISLIKPRLTNVSLFTAYTDFIVLMAYDYSYIYSYLAGPVAPIGGTYINREYDVEAAIQQVLNLIPEDKLILGIPLYGYEWDTLTDIPGSPVVPGTGKTASSRRVEELLKTCDQCVSGIEEEGQQPYLIIPEDKYFRQIFYENKDSLKKKLDLAKKYKLAGVALWALGYEDNSILDPLKSYR